MFYQFKKQKNKFLIITTVILISFITSSTQKKNIEENKKNSLENISIFSLKTNTNILDQLNFFVTTHPGQRFIKTSLYQRKKYENMLVNKLKKYGLPKEILAIPLVESRYQNVIASSGAAGIWQFIPSTARIFNLIVTKDLDQRMNASLETDAAMKYLKHLYMRFKDWRLAILSYNAGETFIQKGINQTGSRDPWVLIENGFEGDKGYLAKVIAAAIVLDKPTLMPN